MVGTRSAARRRNAPVPLSLATLPDVCLLLILSNISIGDVIRNIRRVCSNLNRVALDHLSRRNTLILIDGEVQLHRVREMENPFQELHILDVLRDDGEPWVTLRTNEQILLDCLIFPHQSITARYVARLCATLPNITRLTVAEATIPRGPTLVQLVRLLNRYAPNLVSFCLSMDYINFGTRNYEPNTSVTSLVEVINRMVSLRHLKLNVDLAELFSIIRSEIPTLIILRQLDSFVCDSLSWDTPWLMESMRELANGRPTSVGCDREMRIAELLQFNRQFCNSFKRLTVAFGNSINNNNLPQFCTQYSSLVSLTLDFDTFPMRTLARYLSQLTELIDLELDIFTVGPPEDDNAQLVTIPVPSVRFLCITLRTESHRDTEQLHTPQLFPNVQVLYFKQYPRECPLCDYDQDDVNDLINHRSEDAVTRRIRECMRLVRLPFRACARVHEFRTNNDSNQERMLPSIL